MENWNWASKEAAGVVFLWSVVGFAICMFVVIVSAAILIVVGAF